MKNKWNGDKDIYLRISPQWKGVLLQTLSIFIINQDLYFGGIAMKIEFVIFVYELINYEITFLLLGYVIIIAITSTSDLQPSITIVNQLPGQLVSTQIEP